MGELTAKRLEPIDLMRIYGAVGYDWDLTNDVIDWKGPINKLLSPDSPFITGSSFHNCLNGENFWARILALSQISKEKPDFECFYELTLPTQEHCPIRDTGQIMYGPNGLPARIQGSITFLDPGHTMPKQNLSGYDPLTGFAEKEVLTETLSAFLDQSNETGLPGAYLAATIDKLTNYTCIYGIEATQMIIREIGESLKKSIRFDDFMGRTSGCCFGLVLKDCDKWGIVRASDRLLNNIKKLDLKFNDKPLEVTISLGGIVFPGETQDAAKTMQRAERYLFDAQSIKGYGVSGNPYGTQAAPDFVRPGQDKSGKRRHIDTSKQKKTGEV